MAKNLKITAVYSATTAMLLLALFRFVGTPWTYLNKKSTVSVPAYKTPQRTGKWTITCRWEMDDGSFMFDDCPVSDMPSTPAPQPARKSFQSPLVTGLQPRGKLIAIGTMFIPQYSIAPNSCAQPTTDYSISVQPDDLIVMNFLPGYALPPLTLTIQVYAGDGKVNARFCNVGDFWLTLNFPVTAWKAYRLKEE